jgi:acid phosphatase family membrane protein YuiD
MGYQTHIMEALAHNFLEVVVALFIGILLAAIIVKVAE